MESNIIYVLRRFSKCILFLIHPVLFLIFRTVQDSEEGRASDGIGLEKIFGHCFVLLGFQGDRLCCGSRGCAIRTVKKCRVTRICLMSLKQLTVQF